MAFYSEIYGYINFRGEPPDVAALSAMVKNEAGVRVSFSPPSQSITCGYVSFVGEVRGGYAELEDWFRVLEDFLSTSPFVLCACHVSPEDDEERLYCYSMRGTLFKRVSRTVDTVIEETAL